MSLSNQGQGKIHDGKTYQDGINEIKMTMTLINTNERFISKISHKGLGPIVVNDGTIGFKIKLSTLDSPDEYIGCN